MTIETTSVPEATTADIIPLHGEATSNATSVASSGATEDVSDTNAVLWDDIGQLHTLRRLLILALIEALQKPNPRAGVMNVARSFLNDQGYAPEPSHQEAGLSHIAAHVMAMKEGGMDFPFPTFAMPEDTEEDL